MQNIRIVLHLNRKATDLTPPVKPSVVGTLDGKAGTKDPVEVVTDPNTKVELLDKDGNVIGSGTTDSTGHATITPTVPIPEGNVTVKATDNAEHPNSSTSDPVKATDTTPPTVPTLDTDLGGKAGTQTPITVTTIQILMLIYLIKTVILLVRVRQMIRVMSQLHRQNLFLKVMSLPKRLIMQNIRIVLHLNRKSD